MSWPQTGFFLPNIMRQLKEKGIEKETLVIFTSDNGPHQEGGWKVDYFNSNEKLRGFKRDLYEGGIRVPIGPNIFLQELQTMYPLFGILCPRPVN